MRNTNLDLSMFYVIPDFKDKTLKINIDTDSSFSFGLSKFHLYIKKYICLPICLAHSVYPFFYISASFCPYTPQRTQKHIFTNKHTRTSLHANVDIFKCGLKRWRSLVIVMFLDVVSTVNIFVQNTVQNLATYLSHHQF